jgi:hypothetical protein
MRAPVVHEEITPSSCNTTSTVTQPTPTMVKRYKTDIAFNKYNMIAAKAEQKKEVKIS